MKFCFAYFIYIIKLLFKAVVDMLFLVIGVCALVSKSRECKQSIHPQTFGRKGSRYGLVDKEGVISLAGCSQLVSTSISL